MIDRIINNLKKPHKIPLKIFKKIIFLYKMKKYNREKFEELQNKNFARLGLNRVEAQKKFKKIQNEFTFLNREKSTIALSEHELIFTGISLKKDIEIKNILEIGTFDGVNAFLLSKLFDNATIETIDLEEKESNFKNSYHRNNNFKKFNENRDNLLNKIKNINFSELNSVKLTFSKKKYDLIWIDGAHGYPVCCIDIINSLKLINDKGIILVDDIFKSSDENDKMYSSVAGFDTLEELKKNNLVEYHLFYKRLNAQSNFDEKKIQYVALVKKI